LFKRKGGTLWRKLLPLLRQKYGIKEGNPTFKYNTRKILMILDEEMNDTQTE
jgi:hypothetical protein